MLNGRLCGVFPLIRAFSLTMTASQPASHSDTDTAFLSHLLIFCLFSDIPTTPFPTLLYLLPPLSTPILSRSAVSAPGRFAGGGDSRGAGEWSIQKPLHLWSNSETPRPPRSICHWAECQEVSLGLTSSHSSTWHSERKRRKKEGGGGEERAEREPAAEGEWTWQRPWNTSVPLSRAGGTAAAACQHLSLVKCRWQCDTDYWKPWFRLSPHVCVAAKQRQLNLQRARTHMLHRVQSTLFPAPKSSFHHHSDCSLR